MKYSYIRNMHWMTTKKILKDDFSINLKTSPYTYFKSIIYIEISALIVFFLQSSFITPNYITLFYAFLGLIGGIFIGSAQGDLIIIGAIIFFFKSAIDWSDGLLARLTNKTSALGSLLDDWAGYIGFYSFIIGFSFYLFNTTGELHYIYAIFVILVLKAIDLKNFFYINTVLKIPSNKIINKKDISSFKKNKKIKENIFLFLLRNTLDDRARTIDLICLLILIDFFYREVNFLSYILYAFVFKSLLVFLGNFYLVCFKKFNSNLNLGKK